MKTMNVKDILEQSVVSVLPNTYVHDKNGNCQLKYITLLEALRELPLTYKDKLIELKNLPYHSEEQRAMKKDMPRYYICGKLEGNTRDNCVTSYTHLMTVDIDKKDNQHKDFEQLRDEIFKLPYVLGVYESCSGQGLYCIIPILNGRDTKSHYKKLVRSWKVNFGINVDPQAGNIARARIISYDERWLEYTKTEVTQWIQVEFNDDDLEPFKVRDIVAEYNKFKQAKLFNNDFHYELTHLAMQLLVDNGFSCDDTNNSYHAWFRHACDFKNYPDGYELFYKYSNNSKKWVDNESRIRREYDNAQPTTLNDEIHRYWQGMAKRLHGDQWLEIKEQYKHELNKK